MRESRQPPFFTRGTFPAVSRGTSLFFCHVGNGCFAVGSGCFACVAVDNIVLRYDEFCHSLREVQPHIQRVAGSAPLLLMQPYAHAGGDSHTAVYEEKAYTARAFAVSMGRGEHTFTRRESRARQQGRCLAEI